MSGMALRKTLEIEPGAVRAALLAVLVHIIFFAFMIFGLNWKTYPTEPVMVDLWSSLPPAVEPAVKAAPPPPAPKPVQPPPEVAPLPPKVETPPPLPKPDIALKEKIEKPKPVEKKPVENKELIKKEQERKEKELKEQKLKEQKLKEQKERVAAEVAQLQREQQEANAQANATQAAAQSRLANEMAEYKAKIMAKIRRNIVMPPDLPVNPVAEFDVTLLPGGDILDVRLRASSGFAAFDSAVERGIFLSKPLPLPPDPALFPKFRNLSVKVHYHE